MLQEARYGQMRDTSELSQWVLGEPPVAMRLHNKPAVDDLAVVTSEGRVAENLAVEVAPDGVSRGEARVVTREEGSQFVDVEILHDCARYREYRALR